MLKYEEVKVETTGATTPAAPPPFEYSAFTKLNELTFTVLKPSNDMWINVNKFISQHNVVYFKAKTQSGDSLPSTYIKIEVDVCGFETLTPTPINANYDTKTNLKAIQESGFRKIALATEFIKNSNLKCPKVTASNVIVIRNHPVDAHGKSIYESSKDMEKRLSQNESDLKAIKLVLSPQSISNPQEYDISIDTNLLGVNELSSLMKTFSL